LQVAQLRAHKRALVRLEKIFQAEEGTAHADERDVLVTLIEGYERQHFPMDLPDAVEAIKFRMEQQGLTPKDLEPLIGRSNRVYEVLNRRRGLTLPMIQKLHAGLGIPAESLLRQTVLVPAAR
jgi:HTH-type transcriptional regulator/antitoxin HigA